MTVTMVICWSELCARKSNLAIVDMDGLMFPLRQFMYMTAGIQIMIRTGQQTHIYCIIHAHKFNALFIAKKLHKSNT